MTASAAAFRALHAEGQFLVLANAWDAASARLSQEAGAKAVATSSAALAWCHGYRDGEDLPTDVLLTAVREILRVVRVPLSVDSEAGYSNDPGAVSDYAAQLIDLGVAGINLEDGTHPADLAARKIEAIKARAAKMGGDLFVNARTDVYLKSLTPADRALDETLARGRLYRDAGADGFFVPALNDAEGIRAVVQKIVLPLNILTLQATPPLAELRALGVRRISTGAGPGRAAYGATVRTMRALLDDGRTDTMFGSAADCPNFNDLFKA